MKKILLFAIALTLAAAGWYYAMMRLRFPAIDVESVEVPGNVTLGEEFPLAVTLRHGDGVGPVRDLFIHFRKKGATSGTSRALINADVVIPLEQRRWNSQGSTRLGPFRCAIPAGAEPGLYAIEAGLVRPGRDLFLRPRQVRIPYRNRGIRNWDVGSVTAVRKPPRSYAVADFEGRGYAIGCAGPMDKVFPLKGEYHEPLARSVRLAAAGNEHESFQIVVIPQDEDLRGVTVSPGDLVSKGGGAVVSRENITVRSVGYVTTRAPFYNVVRTGAWPDPLVAVADGGMTVPCEGVQPFWVSVFVPPGTPSGDYEGALIVRAGGRPETVVALSLRVWNFSLPERPTLKTAFDFYEFIMRRYYPRKGGESETSWRERVDSICRDYYLDMLAHRVLPIHNVGNPALLGVRGGEYLLDFKEFGERVELYTRAGQTDFGIAREARINPDRGIWTKSWYGFTGPDAVRGVFGAYGRYLEEKGWLDRAYTYIIDETYAGVKSLTRLIHEGHPGIRNLLTQTPAEGYPDVDIWCVRINNLDPGQARRFREMGKEIWMYVASPTRPFPTIILDGPSLDVRILPWICWRSGAGGLLYWCVNYWYLTDPWRDPMTWPDQNGNGSLFYPGKDGRPVDSIRIEVLRDGLEDYEYLRMLSAAGAVGEMEDRLRGVVSSTWEYARTPAELCAVREMIGERLSAAHYPGKEQDERR